MSKPFSLRTILATATAVGCTLLAPAAAGAATIVNGDFESGDLNGWQVYNSAPVGNWFAYAGTKTPITAEAFPLTPQGNWAAISAEEEPDTTILYQDVALRPHYGHSLSLTLYYKSYKPIFVPSPDTLAVSGKPAPSNQQLRVDVVKPSAPIESLAPGDILATVFATENGDPETMAPTVFGADLTPFAGQTVRLRIANAANDYFFNAGLDAVSITSTPPANAFSRGRLQMTPGRDFLPINVPGAGVLSAADARAKAPKRTRTATKKTTLAGKVLVPLTPTSAGFKTLEAKGKLRLKVRVTFTPTGGLPRTQTFPVTLKLGREPPKR